MEREGRTYDCLYVNRLLDWGCDYSHLNFNPNPKACWHPDRGIRPTASIERVEFPEQYPALPLEYTLDRACGSMKI